MPIITLPDGAQRSFDAPLTVQALTQSIGTSLARSTLATRIDGELRKIGNTICERIPCMLVVGGKDLGSMDIGQVIAILKQKPAGN